MFSLVGHGKNLGFALERMGSHWRVVSLGLVFWKNHSGCCVENRLWVGKARKQEHGLGGKDDNGLDPGNSCGGGLGAG